MLKTARAMRACASPIPRSVVRPGRMRRRLAGLTLWLTGYSVAISPVFAAPANQAPISIERLSSITRMLASDEFEGRSPGTR